jgi:vacuolar iron transporter family protein
MSERDDVKRYRSNLRDELDGAAMYSMLADAEKDPRRADIFRQLASAEIEHAAIWRGRLAALGIEEPLTRRSLRTRVLAALARRFGVRFVLPVIAASEFADRDKYANQSDSQALSADERGHAAVLREVAIDTSRHAGLTGTQIARAESWHRGASGNDLRAAVLGANDGLVSNFCLLMGVAGAGSSGHTILLTGLAGVIAGACSTALGEWLSVTNARELARTQIGKEAAEIEHTPEAEQRELALIYQAKGLPKADAQQLAADLMRDPRAALDTLTREELGIDPDQLGGNAWAAAGTSFLLFTVGAAFPVLPYTVLHGLPATAASIALSAAALAGIGLATSFFSGRSAVFSAVRQVVIGCVAAAFTYGVGTVLGVSLS